MRPPESGIVAIALIVVAAVAGFYFGPIGPALLLGVGAVFVAVRVAATHPLTPIPSAAPVPIPVAQPAKELFADMAVWIFAAVVLRLALVFVLNATPLWRSFAPDALGWEAYGQQQLDYWTGASAYAEPWMLEWNGRTLYAALNAVSLWIFGTARYPLSMLNALVAIGAAAVMARLAKEIWDVEVGRRTFLLCLFFPSIMVWTCMSIRESWAYLAIGTILLGVQQLRSRVALAPILMIGFGLPLLLSIRAYLVPLVVVGAALSLVVVRVRQLPYAAMALALFAIVIGVFGEELGITTELASEEKLEEVHRLRNGLAYGGSAYGTEADTRTWSGIVTYLPEGVIRFLFSPFPWAIRSWRQAITVPESLVWMFLFYQALRGIWQQARSNLAAIATPWFVCTLVTLAYALVSGNEGTAYRHRAQVMMIFFMFSAVHQVRARLNVTSAPVASAATRLVAT